MGGIETKGQSLDRKNDSSTPLLMVLLSVVWVTFSPKILDGKLQEKTAHKF